MTNNNNNNITPPAASSSSSCSAQRSTTSVYVQHHRAIGYRSTRNPTLQFSMPPMSYSSNDKDGINTRFNVARTGRLPVADIIEIALELLDDYNNIPIPNESDISSSQSSEI